MLKTRYEIVCGQVNWKQSKNALSAVIISHAYLKMTRGNKKTSVHGGWCAGRC